MRMGRESGKSSSESAIIAAPAGPFRSVSKEITVSVPISKEFNLSVPFSKEITLSVPFSKEFNLSDHLVRKSPYSCHTA